MRCKVRCANPTSAIGVLLAAPRGTPAPPGASLMYTAPMLYCASRSPAPACCCTRPGPIASNSAEGSGQADTARHVFHRTLNPRLDEFNDVYDVARKGIFEGKGLTWGSAVCVVQSPSESTLTTGERSAASRAALRRCCWRDGIGDGTLNNRSVRFLLRKKKRSTQPERRGMPRRVSPTDPAL